MYIVQHFSPNTVHFVVSREGFGARGKGAGSDARFSAFYPRTGSSSLSNTGFPSRYLPVGP